MQSDPIWQTANPLETKTSMHPVNLPFQGQPDNLLPFRYNAFGDFLRSDHASFWNSLPSMSAIFLSDTANLRSYMRSCYHEDCDNINRVTSEMLHFLQKTSDSILAVAKDVTKVSCPAIEQNNGTPNPQTSDEGMKAWKVAYLSIGMILLGMLIASAAVQASIWRRSPKSTG